MVTDKCLKRVRNDLLLTYVENVIDEDEFVLLYELNNSREIYPFWKYNKFELEKDFLVSFTLFHFPIMAKNKVEHCLPYESHTRFSTKIDP